MPAARRRKGERKGEVMLFICPVTIAPENRDESFSRLKEHGLPDQKGAKLLGAWMARTQQETWAIVEADDAASVM